MAIRPIVAKYDMPDNGPWTKWDEVKQRIGNCQRFIIWAWLALWTDSTLFAAVFLNATRQEGDAFISGIVMKDGREFQNIDGGSDGE